MPSSSFSRGHRGHRSGRKAATRAAPVQAADEARNWADLPLDAISSVLHKLDHIEILMGAGQVCRSWRHAARDEPELWRRIDMLNHAELSFQVNLHGMAQAAVRRSAGQCEAFYAGSDEFLLYLGHQAPSLKSLRLISCYDVSTDGFSEATEGFAQAIEKFPLLEELELSLCSNVGGGDVFHVVGKACPQLKRFRLSEHMFCNYGQRDRNKDDEALGIATMHELRSLQLFANRLTNEGLTAILDNCLHFESLDIRHCFNVNMDDTLRAKCARITTVRLPHDSTDDLYGDDTGSVYDYDLDSEDCDDYLDPWRYLDGVYEDDLDDETRTVFRGLRKLLK